MKRYRHMSLKTLPIPLKVYLKIYLTQMVTIGLGTGSSFRSTRSDTPLPPRDFGSRIRPNKTKDNDRLKIYCLISIYVT